MRAPELVLHAGFPQTGVTMLQRALCRLRPQLHRHGIGLVDGSSLAELENVEGWRCKRTTDPAAARAFEREFAELVDEEEAEVARQSASGVHKLVVSSAHLVGRQNVNRRDGRPFRRFAVPAVAQAIRALDPSRVQLALYTRRQDRLMEFCYLREIQKGRAHMFGRQFPHRFEPVLDYHELLGRLESLSEVEDVRVRPFELVGSSAARYADDFLTTVGLDGQLDLAPLGTDLTPYRVYSRQALRIAIDVNPLLESERDRRLVRDFLIERFPGTDDETTRFLPAYERARILNSYAGANRDLFERYMPDLPPHAYASDEATDRLAAAGWSDTNDVVGGDARDAHTVGDGNAGTTPTPNFRASVRGLPGRGTLLQRSVWLTALRLRTRAKARISWLTNLRG